MAEVDAEEVEDPELLELLEVSELLPVEALVVALVVELELCEESLLLERESVL